MLRIYMEVITSKHKHSRSDIIQTRFGEDKLINVFKTSHPMKSDIRKMNCAEAKKRQLPAREVENSLKEEILQLQKQLDDQFMVRQALEKGHDYRSISQDPNFRNSVVKPAKDLIREISVLELEVKQLERYLLSLYRRRFDKRSSSLSKKDERSKPYSSTHGCVFTEMAGHDITSMEENSVVHSNHFLPPQDLIHRLPKGCSDILGAQTLKDSSVDRSHSSLSHRSAYPIRTSPPSGIIADAANCFHSLPLSMFERAQFDTSSVSLADHLGSRMLDNVPATANQLSEEMIKCISAIYVHISDTPLFNHEDLSSPISFSSSMSETSPHDKYDMCSQECKKKPSLNSWSKNPFQIEGSEDFGGSHITMFEVQCIRRDSQLLEANEHLLQTFRALVSQLEEVDPRKMNHEEKLAFWINVHNALVMHAILVYGVPRSNLRRISLLLKAAYNVGGLTMSVDKIQSSILGCQLPRPGQWFRSLLFPKAKFMAGDARKSYALEKPEPLVQFALSTGSHSDPVVRVYTPKRIYQDLEMAREEYIEINIRIQKEHIILLPKIVESFAKDVKLCPAGLIEMIQHSMPNYLRKSIAQRQQGKPWRRIEWLHHNFSFRYLLSHDLVK